MLRGEYNTTVSVANNITLTLVAIYHAEQSEAYHYAAKRQLYSPCGEFYCLAVIFERCASVIRTHFVGAIRTHFVGVIRTHFVGAIRTHFVGAIRTSCE